MKIPSQRFMRAQEAFLIAAQNLDEAWEADSDIATQDYPFSESFDEIVLRIARWRATTDRNSPIDGG